jgi:hypothetical protein
MSKMWFIVSSQWDQITFITEGSEKIEFSFKFQSLEYYQTIIAFTIYLVIDDINNENNKNDLKNF